MSVYIAICEDRHIDVQVRVFDSLRLAIDYCRKFITEMRYMDDMKLADWELPDHIVIAFDTVEDGPTARIEEREINDP